MITQSDKQELLDVEKEFWDAMKTKDAKIAERLWRAFFEGEFRRILRRQAN